MVTINFKLGIIGCGTIGTIIVETLLSMGILKPNEIIISTRRPQTLQHRFKKILVVIENEVVIKESDLVILCCLPHHIPHIVNDIQMKIQVPMISCVAGLSYSKLVQLFKTTMIATIKVEYGLSIENDDRDFWKNEDFIKQSCKGDDEFVMKVYYSLLTYYENKLPIEIAIRYLLNENLIKKGYVHIVF